MEKEHMSSPAPSASQLQNMQFCLAELLGWSEKKRSSNIFALLLHFAYFQTRQSPRQAPWIPRASFPRASGQWRRPSNRIHCDQLNTTLIIATWPKLYYYWVSWWGPPSARGYVSPPAVCHSPSRCRTHWRRPSCAACGSVVCHAAADILEDSFIIGCLL